MITFQEWCFRLRYALVAAGVFKRNNYIWHCPEIDKKSWKHFYDDGYSPIEAVIEDLKN